MKELKIALRGLKVGDMDKDVTNMLFTLFCFKEYDESKLTKHEIAIVNYMIDHE